MRRIKGDGMESLSRSIVSEKKIPSSVQIGPSGPFPVKVIQMGEGNFLRAFTTWMVNEMNLKCGFAG
ncbi:MAG: hypothetical protein ACRCUT_09640, partial [Spirochaetota bacterium]